AAGAEDWTCRAGGGRARRVAVARRQLDPLRYRAEGPDRADLADHRLGAALGPAVAAVGRRAAGPRRLARAADRLRRDHRARPARRRVGAARLPAPDGPRSGRLGAWLVPLAAHSRPAGRTRSGRLR